MESNTFSWMRVWGVAGTILGGTEDSTDSGNNSSAVDVNAGVYNI